MSPGDHVWLVSRDPANRQYYIAGVLRVAERPTNEPGGELATAYGEYDVIAHRVGSYDLARRFPAEGLLRSLSYETGKPIRRGASVAQAIERGRGLRGRTGEAGM